MVWGENAGFPYLFHLFIIFVYAMKLEWCCYILIHIFRICTFRILLITFISYLLLTALLSDPILVLIIFSADRYVNKMYCWSWINTTGIPVTPAFGYRYTQFQWLILKYLLYFEFAVSFLFPFSSLLGEIQIFLNKWIYNRVIYKIYDIIF